jgi:arylsulfatase
VRWFKFFLAAICIFGICIETKGEGNSETLNDGPLNIVLLYADDWRHDVLGVAGHPVVQTPRLDQMARDGVRFTNSYVTTSICGVSRASLYTGQWMSRHGCRGFTEFQTPWAETFPGLLRDNGYHVGLVGKWHNGAFPADRFDFARSYSGRHWFQIDGESIHVTQRNQNDAFDFLRTRPDGKPFCLTVSFFAPHAEDGHPNQYLPQPATKDLYANVEIPVPANANEESWQRLPPFFDENNEGRRRWGWRFDQPEKYQTMMRDYFALITEIDTVCGEIVDELRRQGVLENTLMIFTTDNGYFHGEHGLADKWYPFEESIRTPMIVLDPRMPREGRGKIAEQIVLNVDIAPTLLTAVGIERPARMQGCDFATCYLNDKVEDWREDFFYEHPPLRDIIPPSEALVSLDWKYMFWPDHDYEQLFDLRNDPQEENDLARNPDYQARLEELRRRFQQLKAMAK